MTRQLKIIITKANQCIRLFLLLMMLACGGQVAAQHQKNQYLPKAFESYLNFQLDSCRYNINLSPASDPDIFYINALLTSTRLYLDDDPDHFDKQKFIEKDLLEKLKEYQFSEEYTTFLKSEIRLQWALLKLKNGDELAGFWDLRKAYFDAKENVEKFPQFSLSYKTLGVLHILFGLIPDKYDWLLALFGIEGDVNAGMSELNRVSKSSHFLSLESGLISGLLHAYLLNDPDQAVAMLEVLYHKHDHLLISYAYVLSLMKDRQSKQALDVIEDTELRHAQPFILPHFYYLKGEIYLQQGSLEKAIDNYTTFLHQQNGKNLIKDAYYKIGICYFIMDKKDSCHYYFERSRANGWAKNEADKYAKFSLESGQLSDKQLYRLRYAIDGGFLDKAFEIHRNMDTLHFDVHDQSEFYYRSARMHHIVGNIALAKINYNKAIWSQQDNNWYFAPNSALQLGLIYSSENDRAQAKKYLLMVDNYKGYPYENSIRQKVKLAMKKLN